MVALQVHMVSLQIGTSSFWIDLKNILTDSITYSFIPGNLSIEQKRGTITLLPKKVKQITIKKTWDP